MLAAHLPPKFRIIINCGPCENFIEKCIESVFKQSVVSWTAYVTVEPCADRTFARATQAASRIERIHVKQNTTRRYSLPNTVDAIARSGASPEDVFVSLDGDDWFATPDALSIIAEAYQRHDCWLTYGSWVSPNGGPSGEGLWPAYPAGTTDFRNHHWLGTAVRTWKKWLWDCVKDADLRDDTGEYFRVAEDRATMLPMLEMCGTERARHIDTPIMMYNQGPAYSGEEAARNVDILRHRSPYPRLAAQRAVILAP
jgi:glycosyltransferase involved in cell wall biosynthesis